MLKPRVFPDHEAASRHAAEWLAERIRREPAALLCLAAGSTPMRTYELVAEHGATEPALFDRVRLLKLDEWGGLAMNDPATCEQHLRAVLVDPLRMADRYVAFESQPSDPAAECARIAAWLEENGPIDICVLGLGVNGHVGFIEPAEYTEPYCHVAELSQESLSHATLRRAQTRPSFGLTLGMADIIQSRHILLLVTGSAKRAPLAKLLSGRITTEFPASVLHVHPDVHLVCDSAAYGATVA